MDVAVVVLVEMAAEWSAGFEVGRFAHRFPRVKSRRRMRSYVRGLLGETERKNGRSLAEALGFRRGCSGCRTSMPEMSMGCVTMFVPRGTSGSKIDILSDRAGTPLSVGISAAKSST